MLENTYNQSERSRKTMFSPCFDNSLSTSYFHNNNTLLIKILNIKEYYSYFGGAGKRRGKRKIVLQLAVCAIGTTKIA